jgi:hypothetical protein
MDLNRFRIPALILVIALVGVSRSDAKNLALVVGVSDYPSLQAEFEKVDFRLAGAEYDAVSVAQMLLSKGFASSDVTILRERDQERSSKVDGPPNRANIMQGLSDLAAKASTGDFVYVYVSAHGSKEWSTAGSYAKKNKLDAILLPRDAAGWRPNKARVENAITDDEILDAVTRIRNKGAFVWLVVDACFSGDIIRGGPVDERPRRVLMETLGVPTAPPMKAHSGGDWDDFLAPALDRRAALEDPQIPLAANAGGLVVFSAAQANEETFERLMPMLGTSPQLHGIFTFTLLETLERYQSLTYEQIEQQILSRYAAMGRNSPTPVVQGDYAARAFGGEAVQATVLQWRVENRKGELHVASGLLSELGARSRLALVAEPLDPDTSAIGYADVTSVGEDDAIIEPVASNGKPIIAPSRIPASAYARLISREYGFGLNVSPPCDVPDPPAAFAASHGCGTENVVARRSVDLAKASAGPLINWVEAGSPGAHIYLGIYRDRLWITESSAKLDLRTTPWIDLRLSPTAVANKLSEALRRIAKAKNLLMLAAEHTAPAQIAPSIEVLSRPLRSQLGFTPLRPAAVLVAKPGQEIELKLKNPSSAPWVVTVLVLDSGWGITPIYPQAAGRNNRIDPGEEERIGGGRRNEVTLRTDQEAGITHILMIAVPFRQLNQLADFSFLGQPSLRAIDVKRGDSFEQLLQSAGFTAATTRGPATEDAIIRDLVVATTK